MCERVRTELGATWQGGRAGVRSNGYDCNSFKHARSGINELDERSGGSPVATELGAASNHSIVRGRGV